MLAGLVRSRDGSRDDTGTHFMNLPSPNVQSEVNVKPFISNISMHVYALQRSVVFQTLAYARLDYFFVLLLFPQILSTDTYLLTHSTLQSPS